MASVAAATSWSTPASISSMSVASGERCSAGRRVLGQATTPSGFGFEALPPCSRLISLAGRTTAYRFSVVKRETLFRWHRSRVHLSRRSPRPQGASQSAQADKKRSRAGRKPVHLLHFGNCSEVRPSGPTVVRMDGHQSTCPEVRDNGPERGLTAHAV